jgi:ABC-2 type transport system permease protein
VIPLPFLPDSVQAISNLMPFRGLLDTPLRIYMGHLDSTGALLALAHQFVWFGVLLMTGRMILSRGLGRMVIHGG